VYNISIKPLNKNMKKEIKKELNSFIKELNSLGFPYSYQSVERNSANVFNNEYLYNYDSLTNIEEIILLQSSEHPETNSEVKFLLVEIYKESVNDLKFGVPSFSYIVDHIDNSNVSCYQLDDSTVRSFTNVSDAVSAAIRNFESQNFQKDMALDIFEELNKKSTKEDKLKDLCMAESLILKFNENGKNLFSTELDVEHSKLIAYCSKYNNWAEISHFDNSGIAAQVTSFLSENYPTFVQEANGLAAFYSKLENKKSLKSKPV
jgi:hypothetical protein